MTLAKLEEERRPESYEVGIYARLSVAQHNLKDESIEVQVEIAKAYMEQQPDMHLYKCYIDLGKTGMAFNREGFKSLMEDVRRGNINCIVVKDFSRFGRNYIETGNYIEKIFPLLGVRFIAVTDAFDSLALNQEHWEIQLKNLINELYAKDIALRVKTAKQLKRKKGSYIGGVPPYGYKLQQIEGRRRLVSDPPTAMIVKQIYRLYEQEKRLEPVVKWLYEHKVYPPSVYRRSHQIDTGDAELPVWSKQTLKLILMNPIYKGQGEMSEPIISEALFLKVTHYLKAPKNKNQSIEKREVDLFKGLVFCHRCQCQMSLRMQAGKKVYCCANAQGKCKEMAYDTLLEAVKGTLIKRLGSYNKLVLEEETQERELMHKSELEQEEVRLQEKIDRMDQKNSERYVQYRQGHLSKEDFKKIKGVHEREKNNLIQQQEALRRQIKEARYFKEQEALGLQVNQKGLLEEGLIQTWIEQIKVFDTQSIEVVFKSLGASL